jgi:uncharacterized integral membrane protein
MIFAAATLLLAAAFHFADATPPWLPLTIFDAAFVIFSADAAADASFSCCFHATYCFRLRLLADYSYFSYATIFITISPLTPPIFSDELTTLPPIFTTYDTSVF